MLAEGGAPASRTADTALPKAKGVPLPDLCLATGGGGGGVILGLP